MHDLKGAARADISALPSERQGYGSSQHARAEHLDKPAVCSALATAYADASRGLADSGQTVSHPNGTSAEDTASDTLTVLKSRRRRLAKLIGPDGTVGGYDAARCFDMATVRISGLGHLERVLWRLQQLPNHAVVRGAIADPGRRHGVRRLLHRDPETGDLPTLSDVPRRWVALDFDGLPLPEGIDAADLAACGTIARSALPAEFHDAACIVQATGSHGIKTGARLRLWFWLDRPVCGAELKVWLRDSPVDPASFSAAQLIYTAAPVFAVGRIDHLLVRMLRLPGAAAEVRRVAAPAPRGKPPRPEAKPRRDPARQAAPRLRAPAMERPGAPREVAGHLGERRYAVAALIRATARVAAAPTDSRHATALREACGLARFVVAGGLIEAEAARAVSGGLVLAGKAVEEGLAVVRWAIARCMAEGEDVL